GRSGRQGDPGASRFYLSLEDDLLRIFGAERIQGLMKRLGMEDGVPIEARMVNRAIENAQRKVEGHNFDLRKHLLEYDDVMNKQREIVYARRRTYLQGEDLRDEILGMAATACDALVDTYAEGKPGREEVDWKGLGDAFYAQFRVHLPVTDEEREKGLPLDEVRQRAVETIKTAYDAREEKFTSDVMRHLERVITLQSIDAHWKDHLLAMDHLKDGIGLRGYGQRNPLQEYQREGYDMFVDMLGRFESDVVEKMYSVQIAAEQDVDRIEEIRRRRHQQMMAAQIASRRVEEAPATVVKREADKVGRNDPCPCGSGKKYKKCHGTA
ncbi:MAG TPA: SEC-C metal-binding domain-containing protein, partial [Candidatus Binatia bacterium]|nr:SEC-C metal-binding domain-containing protein [Candidatus Binatia bacterium]